ncbi:MAG: rhomboid family intramembrane serine protease [Rhodospirillaceae bacterium]|nr:rhomboid family intramembrane serine protease [Rhodospirillaceae bacterium]
MFLPIGDDNPHGTTPFVNYTLIAICVAVFLWQFSLSDFEAEAAILMFGLIPADLGLAPGDLGLIPREYLTPARLQIERPPAVVTIFTSMFLHGGWMHLLGNMGYLWIFGDNIEASLGHRRYLIFYLVCGVAAAAAQVLSAPSSDIPMIGASGAISGVLGAYMMLHPRANIRVFVWLFIYFSIWNLPALIVLGGWFGMQLLSNMNVNPGEPGVAFMAHIGGFVAGAVLVFFFKKRDVRVFEPAHTRPFALESRPIRLRRGGSVPRSGGAGQRRGPWG